MPVKTKLICNLVLCCAASPLFAATVNYSGTFTVADFSTALQPEIEPGDAFDFAFAIDTAALSAGINGNAHDFSNAVTSLTLARQPGNTGSWNPDAGVFQVAPVDGFFANHVTDFVSLIADGVGFPDGLAFPFTGFQLSFPLAGIQDIQPGPAGSSLEQVFGGVPALQDIPQPTQGSLRFNNGGVLVQGEVITVPEPGSLVLLGCGAVALLRRRSA